jgi:hypothetical protein
MLASKTPPCASHGHQAVEAFAAAELNARAVCMPQVSGSIADIATVTLSDGRVQTPAKVVHAEEYFNTSRGQYDLFLAEGVHHAHRQPRAVVEEASGATSACGCCEACAVTGEAM